MPQYLKSRITLFKLDLWLDNPLQSEKMYSPMLSHGRKLDSWTNKTFLGTFPFPWSDMSSLASLGRQLSDRGKWKLSLGKFCSSSNPFLPWIAWRNIYSQFHNCRFKSRFQTKKKSRFQTCENSRFKLRFKSVKPESQPGKISVAEPEKISGLEPGKISGLKLTNFC